MAIRLVSVIGSSTPRPLLREMLDYYRVLGVDDAVIHVHDAAPGAGSSDEARAVCELVVAAGATVGSLIRGPWLLGNNTWLLNLTRAAHPGDWHVLADGDERQLYPDGLTRAIAYCEEHGYDYIQGAFVDRLASDGQLTPIREDLPLSEQYPLGAMLSARVPPTPSNRLVRS